MQALSTPRLAAILRAGIRDADAALIADADYLRVFGATPTLRTAELWAHLVDQCGAAAAALNPATRTPIDLVRTQGPLARRILRAVEGEARRETLAPVYRRLCDCLVRDELFA